MILKLLCIAWLSVGSISQEEANSTSFPPDSSKVQVRTVDAETLQELTDDPVFNYKELAQNPDSFWNRFMQWLFQFMQFLMDNKWASIFIRIAFFGIFAVVLIALINHILGGNLHAAFSGKKASNELSLNIREANLEQDNYEELLAQALSQQNFHDAVRILYLKALNQLNQADLISWKPDKTNHDYLRELMDHPSRQTFNRLTYFYEYVEYGDFDIDASGFEHVQRIYQDFTKQVEK